MAKKKRQPNGDTSATLREKPSKARIKKAVSALASVDGWVFKNIRVFKPPMTPTEARELSDQERKKYGETVREKKEQHDAKEAKAAVVRGDHDFILLIHASEGLRKAGFSEEETRAAIHEHVTADRLEIVDNSNSLTLHTTRDWKKWFSPHPEPQSDDPILLGNKVRFPGSNDDITLQPKEYEAFAYLITEGRRQVKEDRRQYEAETTDLEEVVWPGGASDNAIRMALKGIRGAFSKEHIRHTLDHRSGVVTFTWWPSD